MADTPVLFPGDLKLRCQTRNTFSSATISVGLFSDDPAREGMLKPEEYWAIILSLAISLFLAISLAVFLWRGNRRIKKAHKEAKEQRISQRTRNNHEGAQVGNM